MLSRLPTDENLQVRGCTLVSICVLCYKQAETSTHLFLHCDFAMSLWRWIGAQINVSFSRLSVASLLDCLQQRHSSQMQDVFASALCIRFIPSGWRETLFLLALTKFLFMLLCPKYLPWLLCLGLIPPVIACHLM